MGIEYFERAAEADGLLLHVERKDAQGGATRAFAFLLTFDVGRILVEAPQNGAGLSFTHLESSAAVAGGLETCDEDEPWWRLLGSPVTAAWPAATGSGAASGGEQLAEVRVQFRKTDDNPRVVSLRRVGDLVDAGLEEVNTD